LYTTDGWESNQPNGGNIGLNSCRPVAVLFGRWNIPGEKVYGFSPLENKKRPISLQFS
jgi:hypothetical protein